MAILHAWATGSASTGIWSLHGACLHAVALLQGAHAFRALRRRCVRAVHAWAAGSDGHTACMGHRLCIHRHLEPSWCMPSCSRSSAGCACLQAAPEPWACGLSSMHSQAPCNVCCGLAQALACSLHDGTLPGMHATWTHVYDPPPCAGTAPASSAPAATAGASGSTARPGARSTAMHIMHAWHACLCMHGSPAYGDRA